MNKNFSGKRGFSILEALIAVGLGASFLTAVMTTWFFSANIWNEENVKGRLRYNLEKGIERLKNEVRLSDGNSILFYPQPASTYTAISFPATTPDVDGFVTFSNNAISWNKTVIYHVYQNNGKAELRKTVFGSFNSNTATRQTQLNNVVQNGNDQSGTTTTLFEADNISFDIVPSNPTFDGYNASTVRSGNTSFGSIRLASGAHTVRFEITGKNASSTGYQLGIDTLYLTPSGGNGQEAEAFIPVSASSGDAVTKENMSGVGLNIWGGNHQLAYASNAIGDYVTIQLNYDQWLESNFSNFSRNKISLEGTDPYLTVESRESQSLSSDSWKAEAQTGVSASGSSNQPDKSIRTILVGNQLSKANMVRIKFLAPSDSALTVQSAYFGPRSGGTANFSGSPIQLYFNNGTVAEQGGEDGVGAMGAVGPTNIAIPAGSHAWSNWFEYNIPDGGTLDHLVSVYIPNNASQANLALWTPTDLGAVNSYLVSGDYASSTGNWAVLAGYASDPRIYGTAQLASWVASGTATSQIYDTKLSTPAYNQIKWTSVLPLGASTSVKVRSSADPNMAGATNWDALTPATTSPASLSGLSQKRYLQYQFTLQAASPYTSFPQVDNVWVDWPGATTLVELSGYHTKKSSYGVFKVLVDGNQTIKALGIKLAVTDNFRGKGYTEVLNTEARPRNTGK